jgi:pseudouridine kinase
VSIIVIGGVFVDIKGYPSRTYIPGGRNAGKVRYVHGGVSRNIAEDLGNLGLEPVFLSLVDPTGVGEDVLLRLQEHGVDIRYVQQVPDGMGTWLAVFDNNNDVCASISQRPNLMHLLPLLQKKGNALFSSAQSVLLELDLNEPVLEEIYRLKQKYSVPVYAAVSNINIALERRAFLQQTDCFVCNRQEAGVLFSVEFGKNDPDALARQLSGLVTGAGIPAMVVTLGADGAVWADRNGLYGACPAQQVPVADTTGAGDAFFTGVSAGLTYGKSLEEACAIGVRLASSVICSLENTCPKFLPSEFGFNV